MAGSLAFGGLDESASAWQPMYTFFDRSSYELGSAMQAYFEFICDSASSCSLLMHSDHLIRVGGVQAYLSNLTETESPCLVLKVSKEAKMTVDSFGIAINQAACSTCFSDELPRRLVKVRWGYLESVCLRVHCRERVQDSRFLPS